MSEPINLTITLDDLDRIRAESHFKGYTEGKNEGDSNGYRQGSSAMARVVLKAVEKEPLTLAAFKQMLRGTTQADILPLDER